MKSSLVFITILLLILPAACDTKTTTQNACGDGFVDPGEDCDQTVQGMTCVSIGYYNPLGTLSCNPNCTYNTSDCGGTCGDGTLDVADGEVCDSVQLGSATCASLGYYGGVLACAGDCRGYDETDCAAAGRCGDGVLHAGNGEVCDGDALAGQTCEGLGFQGGTLACRADCQSFDTSGCAGSCGDGEVQTEAGEVCDGANLDDQTCVTLGYHGGELTCGTNCRAFNLTNCEQAGRCGDGAIQISYGEDCDGANLGGQTCLLQGFYDGALVCDPNCRFDTSVCSGRCGDNVIQGAYEQCDGSALAGQTCATQGFNPGTLACTAACTFDTSGCNGRCGDGTIDSPDEQCENTNLNGQTCISIGYIFGGFLTCASASCLFDVGSCNSVAEVSGGAYHTCARLASGVLKCWGSNTNGQLGNNSTTSTDNPVNVTGIADALAVAAGTDHTCAIVGTGSVKCWGENGAGQLGNGTNTDSLTPVTLPGITTATHISAGASFTCIVLADDTVRCWGKNDVGQLGNGNTTNQNSPVTVTSLSNVAGISASPGSHACAVLNNGAARCWGFNSHSQLGNNSTNNSSTPVVVTSMSTAVQITTNFTSSCARLGGGAVQCWGNNQMGQLGDGTTVLKPTPNTVPNLNGITDLSSGNVHTCAIENHKYVRCWGGNAAGQIGDSTTTNRLSPVPVTLGYYANRLGLGGTHSCAVHRDWGSISCWGANATGQLGVGDTNVHRTPTLVVP